MRRTPVLAGLLALALGALGAATGMSSAGAQASGTPGAYRADDFGDVLNIMPPGSDGTLTGPQAVEAGSDGNLEGRDGQDAPPNFADQLEIYDALTSREPGAISAASLRQLFKDASFGVRPEDVVSTITPKPGVTIIRDRFGVPHVYGDTREDVAFGAGYAGTEDRMFLMDALRHVGAARLTEFLGASAGNIAMDRDQLVVAGYTEEQATAQIDDLSERFGAEGEVFEKGADAFIAGINAAQDRAIASGTLPAEYAALQVVPEAWDRADVVYIASLVGGIFGRGGGGEVANAIWLQRLQQKFGPTQGRAVFDDLRHREDGEAPLTTPDRFPYPVLGAVDQAAVAMPDLDAETAPGTGGTVTTVPPGAVQLPSVPGLATPTAPTESDSLGLGYIDAPFGRMPLDLRPGGMSNAILVGADETTTGHPIAVFGPQTGYRTPQLLVELDLHGPGYDARGVSFAGTHAIIQLGRGRDYAWSATSASGDLVDQVVEELCNVDGTPATLESEGSLFNGVCEPMEVRVHRQVTKPSAGGTGASVVVDMPLQRTRHGNVIVRTMVEGKPAAVVAQRSTFLREIDSAVGFVRINDPAFTKDAASFQRAFEGVDYTFNWFYADDRDISYFHSGRLPVRAQGVDFDLPRWGTGRWEWQGFVPFTGQPKDTNPDAGFLANWNNKQATGFSAADSGWGYGSVHRQENLADPARVAIAGAKKVSPEQVVQIMAEAAVVDTRAAELLPELLDVIGSDQSSAAVVALLRSWLADGAYRVDRDRDGAYAHQSAIALWDRWYEKAAKAVLRGTLGDLTDQLPTKLDDHPRLALGSAWNGIAWYGYIDKDLRQVLGRPVQDRYSRTYCGGGALAACRADLRASLAAAIAELSDVQGADPSAWTYDKSEDFIKHTAVGLIAARDMDWQNRPTFQQVAQFSSHRPRGGAAPVVVGPAPTRPAPLPATGLPIGVPLVVSAALLSAYAVGGYRRARRKAMSAA